jgi:hypothetical protein
MIASYAWVNARSPYRRRLNLGMPDAGYEPGEGDEAPSEPAQSDPQGTPGSANVKSGNADGRGQSRKG